MPMGWCGERKSAGSGLGRGERRLGLGAGPRRNAMTTNTNGHHDGTTARPMIDGAREGDRTDWSRPLRVEREVARILDHALDGGDISGAHAGAVLGQARP